jgi:hypothetical protein
MTKDELKNEIKNRISLALKDHILQQGFEIICKENAELKADNKTLREKVHWWKKEVNVAHKAREDEFENLVIENKVLKRKIEKMKNCKNCKNEKIEGACGHFTRVGICKNWEAAE